MEVLETSAMHIDGCVVPKLGSRLEALGQLLRHPPFETPAQRGFLQPGLARATAKDAVHGNVPILSYFADHERLVAFCRRPPASALTGQSLKAKR